jgi:hypothetical protein
LLLPAAAYEVCEVLRDLRDTPVLQLFDNGMLDEKQVIAIHLKLQRGLRTIQDRQQPFWGLTRPLVPRVLVSVLGGRWRRGGVDGEGLGGVMATGSSECLGGGDREW